MVHRLPVHGLALVGDAHHAHAADRVGLVEGEPVAHLATQAFEERRRVADVAVDRLAAGPAVVLLDEFERHLVVADGDHRLDAVRQQLIDHLLVEGEALLVGLVLLARGEDARPAGREAEHAEAHLGHEGDVLAPTVVEVDRAVAGIVLVVEHREDRALGQGLLPMALAALAVGVDPRHLARVLLVAVGGEVN